MITGRDRRELYQAARRFLRDGGVEGTLDARVIFETVFGCPFYETEDHPGVTDGQCSKLRALCQKRVSGYPLQYIAGRWPFLDFETEVGEGVLIPRPDTEAVARVSVDLLKGRDRPAAVDLCAGTGCIAIAVQRGCPDADVTAVEWMGEAFLYLQKNIARLAPAVTPRRADVFLFQRELAGESVDLIVSNPPYISGEEYQNLSPELFYEPESALSDDSDGYRFYRHIAKAYYDKLKPGGKLVFEIGDGRGEGLLEIAGRCGYRAVEVADDQFGRPRVLVAEK